MEADTNNNAEEHTSNNLAQLLARNDQLVSPQKRFQNQAQPFNKFYEKWDKTQNKMDQQPIENFIELITQRYKEKKVPLSIADVGCGYGKQAHKIKKRLEANGVEIQKFYGYDISIDLIQIAREKYGAEPGMHFFRRDLDTQLLELAQFDAIISFCALHWVNNIKATTQTISRALKPKGLFLALIGVDSEDIHQIRVRFINTSKWAESFEENERKVSHWYFDKNIYLDVFQKEFDTLFECDRSNPYIMTHEQCIDFFGNWIPEVRHLVKDIKDEPRQEAIIRAYTSDLMHSVPLGLTKNLIRYEDGNYSVRIGLFEYQGIKN